MNINLSKRIEEIALDLTSQISVVETSDEITMVEKIHDVIMENPYFVDHPDKLTYVDYKGDLIGRKALIAELNGGIKSDKTVILIGHFDTVGISDYGENKEYACKPSMLTEKLKGLKLPPEVRKDLESEEYIFGRGIFDMKSGDAIIIALMEKIAEDIDNFEGNIIFAAVGDEEANSSGMLNIIPQLVSWKKEKGYEYLGIIDPDYVAPAYPGDENKYVYIGTVGKLMPTYYVFGKETHVGESFDGLDPNQIAAALTERINLNPEFSDVVEGEATLPPVTLKQRDLKTEYSVQIANKSIVMFSMATHSWTPDKVLEMMKQTGQECFEKVVDTLNDRYKKYCQLIGRKFEKKPWVARTMTYEELYAEVKKEQGAELDKKIADLLNRLEKDDSLDSRDKSLAVVDFVHDQWSDKDPVLVLYYTPPYYPHIYVNGANEKDKVLIDSVKKAVADTEGDYDYKLVTKKFLPCISDLSYAACPKEEAALERLKINMPGYGSFYNLPLEEMKELDLPVTDIGTFGKDAHKFTERLHRHSSYNMTPDLIYKTIMNMLGNEY